MKAQTLARTKTVAFVTIGQSPRVDIVPDMLARIRRGIEPFEVGLLDGFTREEIASLAPFGDEHRLVSWLRDGTEVVIGKAWAHGRLKALVADLDEQRPFLVVLLCTGHFDGVRSRTLMVESQLVVDHAVAALSEDGRTLGVMVPLREQIDEFHVKTRPRRPVVLTHASPYSGARLEAAARELAATDLIVMHCIGYSEPMRQRVAEVTGRPVLLARHPRPLDLTGRPALFHGAPLGVPPC